MVAGRLTTCPVEHRKAYKWGRTPQSEQRRLQAALARHVRDIARASPTGRHPRVGLVLDHAPWHQGPLVTAALKVVSHRELYRLPRYNPQFQVIERFWKVLRRRATLHRFSPRSPDSNRPCATVGATTQDANIRCFHA